MKKEAKKEAKRLMKILRQAPPIWLNDSYKIKWNKGMGSFVLANDVEGVDLGRTFEEAVEVLADL